MLKDFKFTARDLEDYQEEFKERLPHRMIDSHVHCWEKSCLNISREEYGRYKDYKPWTDFDYMEEFTMEEFEQCFHSLLPGKELEGIFFGLPFPQINRDKNNRYVCTKAKEKHRAFYYVPGQHEAAASAIEKYDLLHQPGFMGWKPYPDLVEGIQGEIRIQDMLNKSFLEAAQENGLCVLLHLPGKQRLKSPLIREELLSLTDTYPRVKFVIAHAGRAFCYKDVEGTIDFLLGKENVWFDTTLINDPAVLLYLLETVSPDKILFGSDAPLAFSRGKDVCINNRHYYVAETPRPWGLGPGRQGLLELSFYLYEELRGILYASKKVYGREEKKVLEKIFYGNVQALRKERGL